MSPIYVIHGTHAPSGPGPPCSTNVETIETSHLVLRPFTNDDVHYIFENWTKNLNMVKQLGWAHPNSIDCIVDWLKGSSTFKWCITVKGQNAPIGTIGIHPVFGPNTCELNFAVTKEYQNRGIMTEALSQDGICSQKLILQQTQILLN